MEEEFAFFFRKKKLKNRATTILEFKKKIKWLHISTTNTIEEKKNTKRPKLLQKDIAEEI